LKSALNQTVFQAFVHGAEGVQSKGFALQFSTIQPKQLAQTQKTRRPDKQMKEFCKETILKKFKIHLTMHNR